MYKAIFPLKYYPHTDEKSLKGYGNESGILALMDINAKVGRTKTDNVDKMLGAGIIKIIFELKKGQKSHKYAYMGNRKCEEPNQLQYLPELRAI